MKTVAACAASGCLALLIAIQGGSAGHAPPGLRWPAMATPAAVLSESGPADGVVSVPVSLLIHNAGEADRLVAATSPVAAAVVVHHSRLIDGQRVMTPVHTGILIPANETVVLEPAASHLMLTGLHDNLVQGETFPLTLRFARAGTVTVDVRVRRKVDAAGVEPIPPIAAGKLVISLASAPPASAAALRPS